ncbi:17980_t:CDS:2 [Cetraspora pellucida]|uniref:17980_t:CDS:1 n=1 Tax=Cetraspora pellucida TaxID=1433469 RepID=A0A9N9BZQ8_9GLOM|nr:17980_t:CDS:2 [Cetraspora pellucida]
MIKLRYSKRSKSKYISKVRSSNRKKRKISDKTIKKAIVKKIKQNNREYTPEFVSLTTNLSILGYTSILSTIQCTKEIITFLTGQPLKSCLSSTDKSTRGEKKIFLVCIAYWNENKQEPMLTILNMKDLDRCLASTVSLSVGEALRSTGGAIIKFNQQYSAKATRIPCGLHALHIASTHFNDMTFGKIKSISGISLDPHPSNVLNLAYYLHCGYNESDKDNPLNMKTEKISELYKALLNYNLKKYQKPISTRWLYQLTTAKLYLDWKDIHLQFSSWFINQLEKANKIPESYLKKWKTFYNFLQNDKLNIEIQIIDTNTTNLPSGFRANEMPDKVEQWINELQIAAEHPDEVFVEEMLLTHEALSTDEFDDLINRIGHGLVKALDAFKRWMDPWTHLPLSICRLGGIYGPDFAIAIIKFHQVPP